MERRYFQLYRKEQRTPDWYDFVVIYEPLTPKQLNQKKKAGWKLTGNRQGDRIN